jgi:hypothetical protein
MIRKIVVSALLVSAAAFAGADSTRTVDGPSDPSRLSGLEKAVTGIMAKAGVTISGEVRSQLLQSNVSGKAAADSLKSQESVEYTLVDFDITARPNDAVRGRIIFRFQQDWRNLFSSFYSPVFSRWISIDGNAKNIFTYNVGDFRQKYTPLTLYSPDVTISYEPEVFSRLRETAMSEEFLGDNNRILQGVNLNFDAAVAPLFKELHVNLMGTRLRSAGVNTSEEGGAMAVNLLEVAPFDKYMIGSNLGMDFLPGLNLGATYLHIFDWQETYSGKPTVYDTIGLGSGGKWLVNVNTDYETQNTTVLSFHGGVGTSPFIDPKKYSLALTGEFAMSADDTFPRTDSLSVKGADTTVLRLAKTTTVVNGKALAVDLKGSINFGAEGSNALKVRIGTIYNDKDFRNDAAQSPSLLATRGARIMNSENDAFTSGKNLYSTYDVLYRQVFEFTPAQISGHTSNWFKAPMRKIAYTNSILTQEEMRALALDPALYLVMPFGAATPNRTGLTADASVDALGKAIHASLGAKFLQQASGVQAASNPSLTLPKTKFTEIGGGASIDVARLGNWWPYPCIVSGGYQFSNAKNDGIAADSTTKLATDVGFTNAGLYWTFWKKYSLLGGFQMIGTKLLDANYDQTHWSAGLEYKVADGGTLTASVGSVSVKNSNNDSLSFKQPQYDLFLSIRF